MKYVTLFDVIDTRTNKHHSVVVVKQRYARFFVPYDEVSEDE